MLISQRKEEPCPILAKNLYAMIHGTKWNERPTDIVLTGTLREEAKRTSSVGNFNAKFYLSPERKYIISAIKQSNITKLTILIVVQVAFFSELTSSVSPAPANALLIGLYKSMISAALTPPLIRLNGMITGISFTTSALGKPVYIGVITRFQSDITTVSDKTAHTSDKTAPFVVLFLW